MTANGRLEALRSDVPPPDARRPDVDHESLGRPVRVLRAGILTSLDELGLSQLRDRGYDVTVVTVDQASPWAPPSAEDVRIGDLRAVPLRPRSFDIVPCALLLDRIQHVELVLDRFVGALRPGGYLLLRIRDRDCALGLRSHQLADPRPPGRYPRRGALRDKKAAGALRASRVTRCPAACPPSRSAASTSCSEAQLTTQWSSPAPPALPAELAGWPACTLGEAQLGDLELITSGAFAPLRGFMDEADTASVAVRGTLADGTPFPVPVTLDVPAAAVPDDAGRLVLTDAEGSPLAVLAITERRAAPDGDPGLVRLAGPVTALRDPEHGPFRKLRRRPEDVRAELAGPVLAYATRRPLNARHLGQLRHYAGQLNARLLVLPLASGPAEVVTRPEALIRVVLAARPQLPAGTLVVPVPLAPRAGGAQPQAADLLAQGFVAAAYGATHLLTDSPALAGLPGSPRNGTFTVPGVPIPVISSGEWAYDPRSEVWRPLALIEPGAERGELTAAELGALLDAGAEVPGWFAPPGVTRELRRARPPRAERGLVVFFTGLSGSGKSTIARGLAEALTERGDRTVSLLDGDQVRQLLSAGLSFSRADRDLNIARIGYVAAEVARHGGIAICAPIAPYAQARAVARQMANEVGDFLLVYVATPVDVCAARDRKGLYAKARAGLITGFTGVSDPYEEPRDADLVLDTSAMTRQEAVDAVLELLATGGWLAGPAEPDEPARGGGASFPPGRAPGPVLRIGPPFRKQ